MSAIYLVLPADFDPARHARALAACLETGAVEAALLWLADSDDAAWRMAADAARPVLHGKGVPLLLGGDAARAARIACEGLHVEDTAGVKQIAAAHAPRLSVGAGGIMTRHNAMVAGESGADYVLFGTLDPARRDMGEAGAIHDLASWWSALFEVPCAACAASLDEAEALIAAGTDFIAVRGLIWQADDEAVLARRLARLAGEAVT